MTKFTSEMAYEEVFQNSYRTKNAREFATNLSSIKKDKLIHALVAHIREQNSIIINYQRRNNPKLLKKDIPEDKLVQFIKEKLPGLSVADKYKDRLLSLLFDRVEAKQSEIELFKIELLSTQANSKLTMQMEALSSEMYSDDVTEDSRSTTKSTIEDYSTDDYSIDSDKVSAKKGEQRASHENIEEISLFSIPSFDDVEEIKEPKPTSKVKKKSGIKFKLLGGSDKQEIEEKVNKNRKDTGASTHDIKTDVEEGKIPSKPKITTKGIRSDYGVANGLDGDQESGNVHYIRREDDEDDEENDEVDNETLFSMLEFFENEKLPSAPQTYTASVIEIVKYRDGEVKDVKYLPSGESYFADIGNKKVRLAKNTKNSECQFYYIDKYLSGELRPKGKYGNGSAQPLPLGSDGRSRKSKYELGDDEYVYLKAGSDSYRLSNVSQSESPHVEVDTSETKFDLKKYLSWSLVFHLSIFILGSVLLFLTATEKEPIEEERFVQVDLTKLEKKPEVIKPKPKPKPKMVKPKPSTPKPKPKPKKVKTVKQKLTTTKPKPKNVGGGSKNGGNLKKRNVKQSGLLAVLGTKTGKQSGPKEALVKVSSLDAVSSLNSKAAPLKVAGLAAKVANARIEVASGELIDTKGSTEILRSGGAVGNGTIAALETGQTGNRVVKGKVSANLSRKVKIQGGLSRDQVKRVIDAHMEEIVYCYETSLATDPGLAGKIVFEWKVELSGRVGEVNIQSSNVRSPQIHSCIKGAIKSWQFPQPSGTSVFVSYPFVFDSVAF